MRGETAVRPVNQYGRSVDYGIVVVDFLHVEMHGAVKEVAKERVQ